MVVGWVARGSARRARSSSSSRATSIATCTATARGRSRSSRSTSRWSSPRCAVVARVRCARLSLEASDPRAAAFVRLHAALDRRATGLALDVAATEAADAFAAELSAPGIDDASPDWRRPVRRAVELMRERLADPLKLDAIAAHAGLDKFHLSRAFRQQTGLPPHAFLIHLRVHRAKSLLAAGVPPSTVAPRVGLCDQSQLNRYFRRVVGATPGEFARATRAKRGVTAAPRVPARQCTPRNTTARTSASTWLSSAASESCVYSAPVAELTSIPILNIRSFILRDGWRSVAADAAALGEDDGEEVGGGRGAFAAAQGERQASDRGVLSPG